MKKEDNKNMKIEKMSKAELIERIEKLDALLKNPGWKKHLKPFRLGVWVVHLGKLRAELKRRK